MRNKIDLLPVTLHELKVSAFHRVWIKVGFGVQLRARTTASGYDIRIRYGQNDTIKKSLIKVEYGARWSNGNPRPTLSCAGCGKLAFQNLYLNPNLEDLKWKCAKCHGVKPWKVRTPLKWDVAEETKFRHLLRRKVDEDILKFELAALRTLPIDDFFASRPYLVPEWVDRVRVLDAALHKKMLRILHGKYRAVMMRRRVQYLNDKEQQWLMEKLGLVFEKSSHITRKEITWLRNRQGQLRSKSPMTIPMKPLESQHNSQSPQRQQEHSQSNNSSLMAKLQNGNQPGSKLDQSSSPPLETDCSLRKTSSEVDTNVRSAEVQEELIATVAKELGNIAERAGLSSALNAIKEK